jgi:PilZ domain
MATDTTVREQTSSTRRWLRYKLNAPVRVIVNRPEKTIVADGRGLEMSEGGICVLAGTELAVGSVVDIEFTSPYSSHPTRVRGAVCNRQGYRYGIEFMAEGDQSQQVQRLRDILGSATGCC